MARLESNRRTGPVKNIGQGFGRGSHMEECVTHCQGFHPCPCLHYSHPCVSPKPPGR